MVGMKSADREEAQTTVKEAFTQLLGSGDRNIIPAYDYVRLNHCISAKLPCKVRCRSANLARRAVIWRIS